MIRGEKDVCLVVKALVLEPVDDLSDRFINQFVFDMSIGIDLSDLIGR
jgi:hypothetical protein